MSPALYTCVGAHTPQLDEEKYFLKLILKINRIRQYKENGQHLSKTTITEKMSLLKKATLEEGSSKRQKVIK